MELNKKLIFLHIPKTAGSTFHMILNKRYSKSDIYNIFGARYSDDEVKKFIALENSEKADIRLLKGHMPFGLHNYMPSKCSYITILRDPVERVISQYYYIKKNKHNPFHDQVENKSMSLQDFVTSGLSNGMNNTQCRFISGDFDKYPYGQCTDDLYIEVVNNINNFFVWIGITDRFDESVLVLSHLLGWSSPPYYIRENVSKIRKSVNKLDKDTIDIIKEYNIFDIKLYEFANKFLDDKISKIENFDEKLKKYKQKNARIQKKWGWLPDRFKYFVI